MSGVTDRAMREEGVPEPEGSPVAAKESRNVLLRHGYVPNALDTYEARNLKESIQAAGITNVVMENGEAPDVHVYMHCVKDDAGIYSLKADVHCKDPAIAEKIKPLLDRRDKNLQNEPVGKAFILR